MARFIIGHFAFASKDKATAEIRRILHGSPLDQLLEGRDASIIGCLYRMHPRRDGQASAFMVRVHSFHGSAARGFYAQLPDGRWETFSYLPPLAPNAEEPSLLRAMRAAIMPSQRETLRQRYNGREFIPCHNPNCRKPVALADAQVHHLAPGKFRDIADAFIGLVGMPEARHSAELGDDFKSTEVRQCWIQFHDAVARRVVLCAECNAADERQ